MSVYIYIFLTLCWCQQFVLRVFGWFWLMHLWTLLSFILFRLSGESPFQGNDDAETLALVTAAQWEFDEESFEEITEEAKNFISSLLEKDPRWFRTACHQHQCLLFHFWLTMLRSPERGCPVTRPLLTPGWLPLNQESWRLRICPKRRWRDILPGRSGRWHHSRVYLSCVKFVLDQTFDTFFWQHRKQARPYWLWKEWLYCPKGTTAAQLLPALEKVKQFHCRVLPSGSTMMSDSPMVFLTFSLNFLQSCHCHQRHWMLSSLWSTRCRSRLSLLRAWRTRPWLQAPVPGSLVTSQVNKDCRLHFFFHSSWSVAVENVH